MKTFKFKKIDAFATQNSDGNPAGVVYLDTLDKITDDEMLKIAQELQGFVSEVAYVKEVDDGIFDLRYFSAEKEVDFCGHATIATMYDMIKNSNDLLKREQVKIITRMGNLTVENKILTEDAVYITAPAPVFSKTQISPEIIAEALKTKIDTIGTAQIISIVNAGLNTLIVPIKSLKSILSLSPDLNKLKSFCLENNIDIITVFTAETADAQNQYRTRVFASTFGYLEDPATGSGNAAFGGYLLKNKLWDGSFMQLEQNGSKESPNIIKIVAKKNDDTACQVVFGGGAIVRIDGNYILRH